MKNLVSMILMFVAVLATGCGVDEHLAPLPTTITIPPSGGIPVGGPGQPGGVCTENANCTHTSGATATCLPLQNGQTERRCSFYEFTTRLTVTANIACYNGMGTQTRTVPGVVSGTVFRSNTSLNEAACVAQGVGAGQCTQSGVRGSDLPCSYTLNPGHATSTWNQTADP